MIIYPAIDLKGGKCVRLYQGMMSKDTIYNDKPSEQAKEWEAAGFRWLHIVDLDGAVKGMPVNASAVRNIIKTVNIPVQLGGGIRTRAHVEAWLKAGVSRVILGTAAVHDPELVREMCKKYPGKIALGIDARDGRVAIEGWAQESNVMIKDLVQDFENAGLAAIVHTDIRRDGTQKGVNVDDTAALAKTTKIPVIASGGVGTIEDIEAVKNSGLPGVIVGKAFYERKLDPVDALKVAAA